MSWLSRYRRRRRRAQDARDATVPLDALLARPRFGRGRTERAVEIPWVLERVRGAGRVLDVGFAHAPPAYLVGLREAVPSTLYGLDLSPRPIQGVRACAGDVRRLPYRAGAFDCVVLISTLEHVGMDNTKYRAGAEREPATQGAALAEVARVLRPGGRALVTVPFGRYEDHGWFVNYDQAFWQAVVEAGGLRVAAADTFAYAHGRGWRRAAPAALAASGYQTNGARAAAGLLCAELAAGAAG